MFDNLQQCTKCKHYVANDYDGSLTHLKITVKYGKVEGLPYRERGRIGDISYSKRCADCDCFL